MPSGPGWLVARVRTMKAELGPTSSPLPGMPSGPFRRSGSSALSGTKTVPDLPLLVKSTPWSKNWPKIVNSELNGGDRPTSVVMFGMNSVSFGGTQPGALATTPFVVVDGVAPSSGTEFAESAGTLPRAPSNVIVTPVGSGPPAAVTVVMAFSAVSTVAADAFGAMEPVIGPPRSSAKLALAAPDRVCTSLVFGTAAISAVPSTAEMVCSRAVGRDRADVAVGGERDDVGRRRRAVDDRDTGVHRRAR